MPQTHFLKSILITGAFLLTSVLAFADPVFTIQNKKDACDGLNNGSFTVNITSASTGLSVSIFGPPNQGPFPIANGTPFPVNVPISGLQGSLAGKNYLVVVQDDDGTTVQVVTIFSVASLSASITSSTNNSNCAAPNGAIDISISGGSGNFTYQWSGPAGFVNPGTQDLSGIAGGSYSVNIIDNSTNCFRSLGPVIITDPSPIIYNVSTTTPAVCLGSGGSITLSNSETGVNYTVFKDGITTGITLAGNTGNPLVFAIPAGQLTPAATYAFTVRAVNGLCTPVFMSGTANILVNPTVTPVVTIAAVPGNVICAGTSVTFTATPTNGGATPIYQWKKNGVNVGANSTTYVDAALVNGDQITVDMTSNATCPVPATVTSNTVTMTVNANVVPTVSIAAAPGNVICAGTNVTFTATPVNGGAAPIYQWKKNGVNVGTNSATYSDAALVNGDQITVDMTSNATCPTPATVTSNTITMTVNANVVPTVSIAAAPGNIICAGTNVTFTATPVNGGAAPIYQWKKNGVNVGTNSATYADAALVNGDQITVDMTSNATCPTPATVTSNTITMTVNANVVPTVSIAAAPGNVICAGTNVTFTATPVNGGAAPIYQWKKNGVNVGTNSVTYADAALVNGDQITVDMTSNATCPTPATVTSNMITMTVNANVVPTVSIAAAPSNVICPGTNVTFTATPVNGGAAPIYQWKKNGVNVGTNSATYADAALVNGDQITVDMTSNATCPTPATVTSNTITMTVNPILVPSVSIVAAPGNVICSGTNVTFTATPVNGGAAPTYQWKKNGINVGSNSPTYADNGLLNGDQITVDMTSNAPCASPTSATSNMITMTVNANVVPTVSIVAAPGNVICAGTSVTFTATPTNGGAAPTYQWKKNGANVGSNSATYTDAGLLNGDQITVDMTSNATCPLPATVTSNMITMTVNPILVPTVSIAAAPGNVICSGTNVTFSATPVNGGAAPVYQWKKNGINVGTNSATYADAGLVTGDQISVDMTSNATCAAPTSVTSNTVTMTVNANVTPIVVITANPGSTICTGTNVTFTATPVNGGASPSYQWKKNGVNVGTNSATYADAALANGDQITVDMTSNATCPLPATVTSNTITMTVSSSIVPIVVITPSPGSTVCAGTNVTFTATPVNGGAAPVYQWKKNGINVGTNSATYADATLANGDQITVDMTSNAPCASPATVTSNMITMTVNATVTPSVTIVASPVGTICAGVNVTFTATPVNGGAAPTYQWKKNGVNVGTNSATYADAGLNDNDVIEVDMTSNATCPVPVTVTSNQITMDVTPNVTPAVAIVSNAGSTICIGDNVTFTATPTNGGTTPAYQWKKNGVNVGTNSTTYSDAGLANGDVIEVVITSNATCVTSPTANSNQITMTVVATLVPSVTIAANPGIVICAGSSVTFTATPVGGGTTPAFQWKKNGVNVGTNSATYVDAGLATNDVIEVTLTSSASCATVPTANSNQLTMTVNPTVTPSVSIAALPNGTICAGVNVTFTATPTNGGASPTYQWKKNGVNVGTNSATYADAALNDNDVIEVDMTSNATCPSPVTVTSNQITMDVTTNITPSVTISSDLGTSICTGDNVTFTAVPTNGGTTPAYQWKKNGVNVGTNSTTYADAGLNNTDVIEVVLTSNVTCVTSPTANSNQITMTVVTNLVPTVSITANPGTVICPGTSVTFTASITGGGTSPSFQWKKDGVNVGTNSSTYTDAGLVAGNVITVDLTSSSSCASTPTVTSNTLTITASTSCPSGNCATVVIVPQPSPATCTLSNGSIHFNINPAVPTVNNTGVKIDITGPANRTNFNNPDFTNLPMGTYTYSIEYGDPSCVKTGTVTIDQSGTVGTPIVSNPTSPACFGAATGAVTIDVAGETGNPLQWSITPANASSWIDFTAGQPGGVQGLAAGTWVVSVRKTSADPCYAAATVTINESAPQILATFSTTDASCQGADGKITIIPGGVYTYELDATPVTPVNNVISNVTGGNHIVTAYSATGCASSFPVTVGFPGFVAYSAPATTIDATCTTKGTIGLFIPNPGSYEIGFTADPLNQPTNYNSAYYNGATGLVLINNLNAGTYYVWIRTSSTSCPTRFENSPGVYEVVIGGPQQVSFEMGCRSSNGDLQLTHISASSADPIQYEIFGNGFQQSGTVTPDALAQATIPGFSSGDYIVWLKQDQLTFGCTMYSDTLDAPSGALDTISVVKNVSFPETPTGSVHVKIQESGSGPYEAWLVETAFHSDTLTAVRNPVIFEVNFTSLAAATYSLFIEDAVGCRKEYSIVLPFDSNIFIPNIFTPNGDDKNETFYVRNLPESGSKLSITNRWGKEVYFSNDYNATTLWDGGTTPDGVYFYRLQVAGGGTYTGWVEIVRGVKP